MNRNSEDSCAVRYSIQWTLTYCFLAYQFIMQCFSIELTLNQISASKSASIGCCSLPRRYMLYKVRTIGNTSPVHASPVCTWALRTILDLQSPCTQIHNRQLAHAPSKIYWSIAVPPGTGRPLPLSPLTLVRTHGKPPLYILRSPLFLLKDEFPNIISEAR